MHKTNTKKRSQIIHKKTQFTLETQTRKPTFTGNYNCSEIYYKDELCTLRKYFDALLLISNIADSMAQTTFCSCMDRHNNSLIHKFSSSLPLEPILMPMPFCFPSFNSPFGWISFIKKTPFNRYFWNANHQVDSFHLLEAFCPFVFHLKAEYNISKKK